MVARLNIEAQYIQENPQVGVHQAWNMQSCHIIGIFHSVSMPDLHFSLRKTPQDGPSVVFFF
jgi:hypothetical protein